MTTRRLDILVGLTVLALATIASADVTSRPADPVLDRLLDRQGVVASRLSRWEDRLYQLSQVLQSTEPEHAARLLDALSRGRNMLLRKQAQDIIENLRAAKLSDAADRQEKLIADLNKLLQVLLDEHADEKDRKQDREELLALRERINQLIKEQEAELKAAQEAAAALSAVQAAEQKVNELLKKQQELSAATRANDRASKAPALAKQQGDLREATETLSHSMKDARQPDEQAAAKAAPAMDKAAEAMRQAQEQLDSAKPDAAAAPQSMAEDELRNALQRLAEEREKLERQLGLDKQAQAQRDTAEKTDALAKKMDREAADPGGGEQKPGEQQPGGQPQPGEDQHKPSDKPGESPQAGSQQVREAVPHQRKAAQKLDQNKPSDATNDQRKALDKLQQARQEIEDALEQLRKEQQEELLAALESRFAAMLAKQIETNKRTNQLDSVGKDKWSRADQLELVAVAKDQDWVGDEAESAMKILKEDGTTIVVPQIIEQVRDDAHDAGKRLAAADTGANVRQIQESIVATLQDLLDAVREMQKKHEKGESGGNESGDSDRNPPLLPGSAELKLLKSWQIRVNRLTEEIDKLRGASDAAPDLSKKLNSTAKRQAAVAQMARDLVEGEQSRPPAGK
jgi:hypothetical protein